VQQVTISATVFFLKKDAEPAAVFFQEWAPIICKGYLVILAVFFTFSLTGLAANKICS
jgi:hypothetical protein